MGIGRILFVESIQDQSIPNEDLSSAQVEPPSSTHNEHTTQDEVHNQEQASSPQPNDQDQVDSKYFFNQMIKVMLIQVLMTKLKSILLDMMVNPVMFVPP
jgi:hypothetical protein